MNGISLLCTMSILPSAINVALSNNTNVLNIMKESFLTATAEVRRAMLDNAHLFLNGNTVKLSF